MPLTNLRNPSPKKAKVNNLHPNHRNRSPVINPSAASRFRIKKPWTIPRWSCRSKNSISSRIKIPPLNSFNSCKIPTINRPRPGATGDHADTQFPFLSPVIRIGRHHRDRSKCALATCRRLLRQRPELQLGVNLRKLHARGRRGVASYPELIPRCPSAGLAIVQHLRQRTRHLADPDLLRLPGSSHHRRSNRYPQFHDPDRPGSNERYRRAFLRS